MSDSVYKIITDRVIQKLEALEKSNWQKPWFPIGLSPYNAISGKTYRGLNYVTLGMNDYKSCAYASFKQWSEKGCTIRKGEKAHTAVFWKVSEYEDAKTGEIKNSFLLRFYNVFNSEQVDGDFARQCERVAYDKLLSHDPHKEAERLINSYLAGNPSIKTAQSDRAYYQQDSFGMNESIAMPLMGQFKDAQAYYSTYLHEIAHSTGNDKRLKRDLSGGFGSKSYAFEELIAELSSIMLSSQCGLSSEIRDDHIHYVKSWLSAMKQDSRYVIQAASAAQKVADYVLAYTESKKQKIAA